MALVAMLLIYQGYYGMRANVFLAAEGSLKHASTAVNQAIQTGLKPSELILRFLNQSPMLSANTIKERMAHLPAFVKALNASKIGDAIFIGYENGEMLVLRRYVGPLGKLKFTPPAGTQFLIATRTIDPQTPSGFKSEVWFLDSELALLGRNRADEFDLDPRTRAWYKQAIGHEGIIATRAFVFFDTGEISLIMAEAVKDNKAVVGIGFSTNNISSFLEEVRLTPNAQLAIIDKTMEVVAAPGIELLNHLQLGPDGSFNLESLGVPVLNRIATDQENFDRLVVYTDRDTTWYGMATRLNPYYGNDLKMLVAIPGDELLEGVHKNIVRYVTIAAITVVLSLVGAVIFAKRLVYSLGALSAQINKFGEFSFSSPLGITTRFKELQQLGSVLTDMETTINGLLQASGAMNYERNLEKMLLTVLEQLLAIAKSEGGAIYLYARGQLTLAAFKGQKFVPTLNHDFSLLTDEEFKDILQKEIDENAVYSLLRNRDNQLVGVLCIVYDHSPEYQNSKQFEKLMLFVDNISPSASIAIETRQLIKAQKELINGMTKLIAYTVDAKSPATGEHCQRVPELACMLADEMSNATDPPFDAFTCTPEQQEEFRVAAWLHDCGKIITPEHLVSKSTKLETLYNRIHEIRTRFEVLHREATIRYLASVLDGGDPQEAKQRCETEQARLKDEFNFVALCNIGGESMGPEKIKRLHDIGGQTWLRHFDARLGLSTLEKLRYDELGGDQTLPAQEQLLADKLWQITPWDDSLPPVDKHNPANVWGFDMDSPPEMQNNGELYNLSIARGTLNPSERFIINYHVVQSIIMLSKLPWPDYLKNVPSLAGTHHETLNGKGYPKKLSQNDISLEERILPIADIFEALTSPSRPYTKSRKTVGQALDIMADMVAQGALDADIFALFLKSGLYLQFAQKYLNQDQIEPLVVDKYLEKISK